jgi:hypothetical protein
LISGSGAADGKWPRNTSIDLKAAEERAVQVVHTGYAGAAMSELTWTLNDGPRLGVASLLHVGENEMARAPIDGIIA